MKKTVKLRYTLLGALLAVMVSQLCVPALAALAKKTIEVYTGVNIYVDDVKLSPKDANGNPVEVFVYNGTTYLPVRAVGEAYGKVVQWDGSTQSVYLGKHDSETPAILLQDLDYFTGGTWDSLYTSDKDNLGNTYNQSCSTRSSVRNVYKLNGQYTRMTGTFYLRYESRSSTRYKSYLKIYGDGKLLFDGKVTAGVEPIFFDLDLTGILELEVFLDGEDGFSVNRNRSTGVIGDCGLYS